MWPLVHEAPSQRLLRKWCKISPQHKTREKTNMADYLLIIHLSCDEVSFYFSWRRRGIEVCLQVCKFVFLEVLYFAAQ